MQKRNPLGDRRSHFGGSEPTHEDVNPHLRVPGLADKEGERIIAKPISLDNIWPDMAQPRRVIPAQIRHEWDGNPINALRTLQAWRAAAEEVMGAKIQVKAMIEGDEVGPELDKGKPPSVLRGYVDLVKFAADIRRNGLINPITVVRDGDGYQIETGERRWWTFNLLAAYSEDASKYERIPAQLVESNIWQQAGENANRRALDAIENARLIALLLMDLYKSEVEFRSYREMVQPVEIDRKFYAQVANGSKYPLRAEWESDLLAATGLPSRNALTRHRRLMSMYDLPDAVADQLWLIADRDGWPEFNIRTHCKVLSELLKHGLTAESLPIGRVDTAERMLETLPIGRVPTDERTHETMPMIGGDDTDERTHETMPMIGGDDTDEQTHETMPMIGGDDTDERMQAMNRPAGDDGSMLPAGNIAERGGPAAADKTFSSASNGVRHDADDWDDRYGDDDHHGLGFPAPGPPAHRALQGDPLILSRAEADLLLSAVQQICANSHSTEQRTLAKELQQLMSISEQTLAEWARGEAMTPDEFVQWQEDIYRYTHHVIETALEKTIQQLDRMANMYAAMCEKEGTDNATE
jgi:hypothetical protein